MTSLLTAMYFQEQSESKVIQVIHVSTMTFDFLKDLMPRATVFTCMQEDSGSFPSFFFLSVVCTFINVGGGLSTSVNFWSTNTGCSLYDVTVFTVPSPFQGHMASLRPGLGDSWF